MRERIVVFANSCKHHEHCVAGKTERNRTWVRPVSNSEGGELTLAQVHYRNPYGTYPVKPLQIIEMEFSRAVPLPNQPENWLITDFTWQQRFKIELNQIGPYLDDPESLWGSGDRVQYSAITSQVIAIEQSLYLVRAEDLRLLRRDDGKRRALFNYGGIDYDLAVTDPNFDRILGSNIPLSNVICVSLAEVFNGACFKLVATLFPEPENS